MLKHTLGWNFKSCYWPKVAASFVVFIFSILCHTKRERRRGKLYAYMCKPSNYWLRSACAKCKKLKCANFWRGVQGSAKGPVGVQGIVPGGGQGGEAPRSSCVFNAVTAFSKQTYNRLLSIKLHPIFLQIWLMFFWGVGQNGTHVYKFWG